MLIISSLTEHFKTAHEAVVVPGAVVGNHWHLDWCCRAEVPNRWVVPQYLDLKRSWEGMQSFKIKLFYVQFKLVCFRCREDCFIFSIHHFVIWVDQLLLDEFFWPYRTLDCMNQDFLYTDFEVCRLFGKVRFQILFGWEKSYLEVAWCGL